MWLHQVEDVVRGREKTASIRRQWTSLLRTHPGVDSSPPESPPDAQQSLPQSQLLALIPDTLQTGSYVQFLTNAGLFADPIGERVSSLRQTAIELYAQALAVNTNEAYATAWKSWVRFCEAVQHQVTDVRETTLVYFVAYYRAQSGGRHRILLHTTLAQYISGILSHMLDTGVRFPDRLEWFRLARALRAAKKYDKSRLASKPKEGAVDFRHSSDDASILPLTTR
jgi:hypothetical protein